MEWYFFYLKPYESNTTQLFWVFNQSVPVWLIVILFLQLKTNKNSLAVLSLTFTYSSWAVFGMIPFALWQAFKLNKKFSDAFSFQNIFLPLTILILYGTFYTSGNGIHGKSFLLIRNAAGFAEYLLFIFLEFGFYFLIMGAAAVKYDFYHIVLIELLLFPFYQVIQSGFISRGSIPAAFIMMVLILKFLFEKDSGLKTRKIILTAALVIGMAAPMNEINRSILHKSMNILREYNAVPAFLMQRAEAKPDVFDVLRDKVYSIGKMKTDDKELIELFRDQFFVYDYQNSIFFRYFAKKNSIR